MPARPEVDAREPATGGSTSTPILLSPDSKPPLISDAHLSKGVGPERLAGCGSG